MQKMSLENLLSIPREYDKRKLADHDAQTVFRLFELLDLRALRTIEPTLDKSKPVEINELRKKMRDTWLADSTLVDQCIEEHTATLTEEEIEILRSWKSHRITGNFLCLKYAPRHAVFHQLQGDDRLYYAVLGISEDFESMIRLKPPYLLATTLLPYKNQIIWDGLIMVKPLDIPSEIHAQFIEEFKIAQKSGNLITRLF